MIDEGYAQILIQVKHGLKLVQKECMLVLGLILETEVPKVLVSFYTILELLHTLKFSLSDDAIFQS